MNDFQPARVDRALRELGASRADMREANKHWQARVRSPGARGALARYRSVLGPPRAAARRRIGDLECDVLQWELPLWPDLRFEVLGVPGSGAAWNAWLVRAPGAEPPALRTVEDLTPWSCTVDEAARAFAPARPREGSAPTRSQLAFAAPDRDGVRHEIVAEFTWGLLQRLPQGPAAP
ncbi:hypothetical protein SALCHL_005259 [Streptomyces albus subsp. chlorinus]|uniref:hypothetical protein n=1 Tax=Streptomyces albus TaxID=1888 RepID=UPI001FAE298C|nr:hypothetical protein [Streptomyces albus]